jgi:hypothetical protein
MEHNDIIEVLGAYALDAVDPDEARVVEEHLQTCSTCSAEVLRFREVAGLLANSGGDAPDDVWRAISAQIEGPPDAKDVIPLGKVFQSRSESSVKAKHSKPWLVDRVKPWMFGAAAALIAIGALGVEVSRLHNQVNQLQGAQTALSDAAQKALSDPQARQVRLDATHAPGSAVAEIAILPSGTAFLVNHGLPAVSSQETYQLWGQLGHELISLGLLGSSPNDVVFHVDPSAHFVSFAVTAERAGGVVRTTNQPVAASPAAD